MDNKDKTTIEKKAEAKKPEAVTEINLDQEQTINSIELEGVKLYSNEIDMNSLCGYLVWLLTDSNVQNYLEIRRLKEKVKVGASYVD